MARQRITGKNGSRVSQRRKANARSLTVDDFDLHLQHHVNGKLVDQSEGREARLPSVIRGMRQNKSIREIAFEVGCCPATVANDKRFVLEEAWELRQGLMSCWMEEQLQGYEHFLGLLHKELMVELMEKQGEGKEAKWVPKIGADGKPIIIVNQIIMDKMLTIMDKVNELKGLKQATVALGINVGDNANISFEQDSGAATELLDYLKSGKMAPSQKALV